MPNYGAMIIPPSDLIFIIQAATAGPIPPLPDNCRGLLIGTAGVLDITINGSPKTGVPFISGINPGRFESIQVAAGNSALTIFAVV